MATAVTEAPAVLVLSGAGAPLRGVTVKFAVVSGAGELSGATQLTDSRGIARVERWVLGTVAGEQLVTATLEGSGLSAVTFRAVAMPGSPQRLKVLVEPPATIATGSPLIPAPAVRLEDAHGNAARVSGIVVSAQSAGTAVILENAAAVTDTNGVARFTALTIRGDAGSFQLSFAAPGLGIVDAAAPTLLVPDGPAGCLSTVPLDFALGDIRRVTLDDSRGLTCLQFDQVRHSGHQFLILLENMPLFGSFDSALFSAQLAPASPRLMNYTLGALPSSGGGAALRAAALRHVVLPAMPDDARHAWDFGAGPIYEIEPVEPPGGVVPPRLLRPHGQMLDLQAAATNPQIGDTLVVRMEGITRLGIPNGDQKAVIRFISDDLVIAEDARLTTTLTRQGGSFNTPLQPATMDSIAKEYAAHARAQGSYLFDSRFNAAIEATPNRRVIAVHSIMYADNIWGYTYSSGNYFVWDYWVGSDGSTPGSNQQPHRVADNLIMHEIAHMREVGLLQRNGNPRRGNRWIVEGFARFSERLPIASRLLATPTPSRTSNLELPRNPAFGGGYFRDDVPTYLNMTTSMFGGYQHSAFVFDYFADQVALRGQDWTLAMRQFVTAAGRPETLDAATLQWVGVTFPELFTRSRIALFLDDIDTPGLPDWTQYHQYQLRASRPPGTGVDPRNVFPVLVPGEAVLIPDSITPGSAWGYVIDGTSATASSVFSVTGVYTSNGVLSITRIR